jgi:hypothetical protein
VADAIHLVCTGVVHENEETYTRHEGAPPPLCDFEGPLVPAMPSNLAQRIALALECGALWAKGSEGHPRITQALADFNAWRAGGEGGRDAAMVDADARDAARYRWLRQQHWSEAPLCVVVQPRHAVKLGHDCPALERLDAALDEAMAAPGVPTFPGPQPVCPAGCLTPCNGSNVGCTVGVPPSHHETVCQDTLTESGKGKR